MSFRAMKWARHQRFQPTDKLVLLALADAADDRGTCCSSIAMLAAQCAISPHTVRRVLHRFAGEGLAGHYL